MPSGKNLEDIIDSKQVQKKEKAGYSLKDRVKRYYTENIGKFRQYIAPLAAISIGVANWSKDFAASKTVNLPLIYENTRVSGTMWYLEAFLQELATMSILVATAKEKKKIGLYALAYEAGSIINYCFYSMAMNGIYANYYGRIWNDIFYFFQIPVFLLSLRHYYGAKKREKRKPV